MSYPQPVLLPSIWASSTTPTKVSNSLGIVGLYHKRLKNTRRPWILRLGRLSLLAGSAIILMLISDVLLKITVPNQGFCFFSQISAIFNFMTDISMICAVKYDIIFPFLPVILDVGSPMFCYLITTRM